MKHITREGLKKMMDDNKDFVLLNAQTEELFQKEHIPGSINIPWRQITIADKENKIPKDKSIVVYCGSFTCGSSVKAATILELLGYKVIEYDGGMDDWKAVGNAIHTASVQCDC